MAKTAKKTSAKTSAKTAEQGVTKESELTASPEQTTQSPTAEGDDNQQLTITDLQSMAQVINLAVRRGAFDASEVGEVGAIYGKLSKFLQIVAEQVKKSEGDK